MGKKLCKTVPFSPTLKVCSPEFPRLTIAHSRKNSFYEYSQTIRNLLGKGLQRSHFIKVKGLLYKIDKLLKKIDSCILQGFLKSIISKDLESSRKMLFVEIF